MTRFMLLVVLLASLVATPTPVARDETAQGWQKGFAFWARPAAYGTPGTFQSLRLLRRTGATVVVPIVTWYVSDPSSSEIVPGEDTPSDADLATVIDSAHWLGLSVVPELHINSQDGTWRGFIKPRDATQWFANYRDVLLHYVNLAQQRRAEGFIIGAELVQLTRPQYTKQWQQVIAQVRQRFTGFITYGANWGSNTPVGKADDLQEFAHVQFWPSLDYIGISAYFELSRDGGTLSRKQLFEAWNGWRQRAIGPVQARFKMPVLFTEVGYRSTSTAAARPWDFGQGGGVSLETQSTLLNALFDYWRHVPWFRGVYLWYWSTDAKAGGLYNDDYSPQGKPAEDVIKDWFRLLPSASLQRHRS